VHSAASQALTFKGAQDARPRKFSIVVLSTGSLIGSCISGLARRIRSDRIGTIRQVVEDAQNRAKLLVDEYEVNKYCTRIGRRK